MRILGIILIVAGLAGLAVGSFSYTETKDVVKLGPINVQARETEFVTIPRVAGRSAVVLVARSFRQARLTAGRPAWGLRSSMASWAGT